MSLKQLLDQLPGFRERTMGAAEILADRCGQVLQVLSAMDQAAQKGDEKKFEKAKKEGLRKTGDAKKAVKDVWMMYGRWANHYKTCTAEYDSLQATFLKRVKEANAVNSKIIKMNKLIEKVPGMKPLPGMNVMELKVMQNGLKLVKASLESEHEVITKHHSSIGSWEEWVKQQENYFKMAVLVVAR